MTTVEANLPELNNDKLAELSGEDNGQGSVVDAISKKRDGRFADFR